MSPPACVYFKEPRLIVTSYGRFNCRQLGQEAWAAFSSKITMALTHVLQIQIGCQTLKNHLYEPEKVAKSF